MYLSKLLPAETLLLLEDKKASLKDLLKTTFMDLLLKQTMEIKIYSKQLHKRHPVRYYKYITRGKNFDVYTPQKHELIFISPYHKSSSIKILFQHLVQIGYQNSKSESKYRTAVIQSPNINQYFTRNFIQTVFGSFSITQEGLALRDKLKGEIDQLEKELPSIIETNKEKALQLLNTIGGNIFLLKNIDFSLLQQIDSQILAEMERKYTYATSDSTGFYGCSIWDSGCSGCGSSGCSGCSGCGGGGGCS